MWAANRQLDALRADWLAAWPAALAAWSRYVQMHEPVWCFTAAEEQREQLSGSFAMIRLIDHSIVISLRQVQAEDLGRFAKEILAHEIGHHVYCPADLTDNARLLSRMRYGLAGHEAHAPMIANLYADLLINDRLQRSAGLNMAGVYQQLATKSDSRLWTFYMRIYELLWILPPHTLAQEDCDARLDQDAQLGARLIRSYAKDWLDGGGRFAVLCLPYLMADEKKKPSRLFTLWNDTRCAGRGGLPEGLAEIEAAEISGAIHPAEDAELTGLENLVDAASGRTPPELSGQKSLKNYRQPFEYREVLRVAGVDLDDREITARYYRELALPHLIPFPEKRLPQSTEENPEGLELWDIASPLERIDWLGTLAASPQVVPGITTRQRETGESPDADPQRRPFDLYLGIDCSGSMGDPANRLSYPVLAGAIVSLSALRAGSRVKVVLSGEPGSSLSTEGFVRDQKIVLRTLASYLGTGYAFGIHRLDETFGEKVPPCKPAHILIVSDSDMFSMLDEKGSGRLGWHVAREALARCGGGGTFVLQISNNWIGQANKTTSSIERLKGDGWNVSLVDSMEELVVFARTFSKLSYQQTRS